MSDKQELRLKPCPFCGAIPVMRIIPNPSKQSAIKNWYAPRCTERGCCGRIERQWKSEELAVKAWNRRANDGQDDSDR